MDDSSRKTRPFQVVIRTGRHVATAYSQVFFSTNALTGLLFLAATFVSPWHGLSGLTGMLLSNLTAWAFGQPRDHIRDGYYGFNGLLIGLALGLFFKFSAPFVLLLALTILFGVIVAATLRNLFVRYLGTPVLSLPFVLGAWVALLAIRRFTAVEITLGPVLVTNLGAGWFPAGVELYLRSLGAAFFQLSALSGMLVFLGLLVFSRWAVLLSIVGFAGGYSVYYFLGGAATDLNQMFLGFNFILTAIAVGGIWIVLCPASILFATVGGALSALVAAGLTALLIPYQLPVLAMPFFATTNLMLFVVLVKKEKGKLQLFQGAWGSPEENLDRTLYRAQRYPDPALPVVFLPVAGQWIITQGTDDEKTHVGPWNHAWDFEVAQEGSTFRGEGLSVEEYFAYNAPVFSPGDGKVVRVVNHVEDNAIGDVNTANNWGNLVIIWHVGNVHSALCHLKKDSVKVSEGEIVRAGQLLGRIGNSGRCPVPHLHFQLQASPDIGGTTLYSEFLHYQEIDEKGTRYVTHGVPKTGDVISALQVEDAVRRALTFAPGRVWDWEVKTPDRTFEEIWVSKIDPLGNRTLEVNGSRRNSATLSFYADRHYTTMLDYQGSPGRLLGMLYLGLPRVPYLQNDEVQWEDNPSAREFLGPMHNLLRELMLPFTEITQLKTVSKVRWNSNNLQVTTKLSTVSTLDTKTALPDRIEIEFRPDTGPCALRTYRAGTQILSAELKS